MIYIETGSDDVSYNLALEYYFAAVKPMPETVFLFWPTSPTIVVGKFQNVLEEINKPYVDEKGIKIVRRLSGGGTIYADKGNFMYTFIQHQDVVRIEFHRYLEPVISALKEMGVEASFNGRNDLVIDGRKFSGNSQYRTRDRIVHHGTIMLDVNVEEMVASTTVDSHKILSKSVKSVRERVTNIAEHLKEPIAPDVFKKIMVRHIMGSENAALDGTRENSIYVLTPEDDACIQKLADEMFRGWDKIYGKSPKFNIERTGYLPGGKMQFKLEVEKGVITQAAVYGDFFSALDADTICASILGIRYERENVYKALCDHGIDGALYRITAKEMAELIAD